MTVSDQQAGTWTPLPPPFSKYEVFSSGYGPDQRPVRRIGAVTGLATTPNNHGDYPMVKVYDDTGRRQTKTVHSLVLLGFDGPCPPGMESRHLDDDPLNNRWAPGATRDERMAAGGNLMYGDKAANAQDKFRNGRPRAAPPPPPRPCVRCGALFSAKGRRCPACITAIGQQAADMLRAGKNLDVVTLRAGYQNQEWVHTLACRHGGYAGSLEQAQAQGRSWSRRVMATLRHRMRIGSWLRSVTAGNRLGGNPNGICRLRRPFPPPPAPGSGTNGTFRPGRRSLSVHPISDTDSDRDGEGRLAMTVSGGAGQ